jgi:7-cyano-7-deazaguanine synthase in queuosine biosynthesis
LNDLNIIAVASNIDDTIDPLFGDNSIQYWQKKTEEVREGIRNQEIIIIAPFLMVKWKKSDIIKWCHTHHISLDKSWSCWHDESLHCGVCRACSSRKDAFREANINDYTRYNS